MTPYQEHCQKYGVEEDQTWVVTAATDCDIAHGIHPGDKIKLLDDNGTDAPDFRHWDTLDRICVSLAQIEPLRKPTESPEETLERNAQYQKENDLHLEIARLRNKNRELEDAADAANARNGGLLIEVERLKKELKELEVQHEGVFAALKAINREKQDLEATIEDLKDSENPGDVLLEKPIQWTQQEHPGMGTIKLDWPIDRKLYIGQPLPDPNLAEENARLHKELLGLKEAVLRRSDDTLETCALIEEKNDTIETLQFLVLKLTKELMCK